MKLIRVLVTIVLALILFPTIFLTIQGSVIYYTAYNPAFVEDLIDDYNLAGKVTKETVNLLTDMVESQSSDLESMETPIPINMEALTKALDEHLDTKDIARSLDDLIIGFHAYYFTDKDSLPVIPIGFLDDLLSQTVLTITNDLVKDSSLSDLSQVSSALEAGHEAGLITEDSIDTALDYLRNSDIEVDGLDKNLIISFVEAYEENHLQSGASDEELAETLSAVVLKRIFKAGSFSKATGPRSNSHFCLWRRGKPYYRLETSDLSNTKQTYLDPPCPPCITAPYVFDDSTL